MAANGKAAQLELVGTARPKRPRPAWFYDVVLRSCHKCGVPLAIAWSDAERLWLPHLVHVGGPIHTCRLIGPIQACP